EDREGAGVGVRERERDGIADAEAHAEVGGAEDSHTLHCKACRFTMQRLIVAPVATSPLPGAAVLCTVSIEHTLDDRPPQHHVGDPALRSARRTPEARD